MQNAHIFGMTLEIDFGASPHMVNFEIVATFGHQNLDAIALISLQEKHCQPAFGGKIQTIVNP